MMPRKMTVYLAAPPGDGLRQAREHFHLYVKPVLVAAAMDWDVVEGRKEGDVRYKTAERIRKKRRKAGEGEQAQDETDETLTVEDIRKNTGTVEYEGIAGDIVIGRNTWKEYIRGLHEGWLGPVDILKPPETEQTSESEASMHTAGHSSLGDAAVKAAVNSIEPSLSKSTSDSGENGASSETFSEDASPTSDTPSTDDKSGEEEKKEEEKPKPRQPPPYIQPSDYPSTTASPRIPELIGPSTGVPYPHIL